MSVKSNIIEILEYLVKILDEINSLNTEVHSKNSSVESIIKKNINIKFLQKVRNVLNTISNEEIKWFDPFKDKLPCNYKTVHGIIQIGSEYDVVECWWTGNKWVIGSSLSVVVTPNILAWKYKPEIPEHIKDII